MKKEQMSPQILAFALALIAILGMVSADTKAVAGPTVVSTTSGPIEDIGKSAGAPAAGNSGPAGSESPAGAAPGQAPNSNGATTMTASSALAGAVVIVIYFNFIF